MLGSNNKNASWRAQGIKSRKLHLPCSQVGVEKQSRETESMVTALKGSGLWVEDVVNDSPGASELSKRNRRLWMLLLGADHL